MLYKHDLNNRFAYVSPQYQTMLGYGPQDLQTEWTQFLTDNPVNGVAVELTERAFRTGERQPPYLVEIRKKDGTPVLLEIAESPLKDSQGHVVAIVGAARDVTDREKAERTLRALYASMNEGLALHELVYDASGQPVDYRILEVNPAFEAITGLSRKKAVGELASAVYGTGEPPYLDVFARVATSGEPATFETCFAPLEKHFAISVFSPGKGQFATVFTDISKRKEAERQICLLNQVYSLVSHINEAIVRLSDRESLFRETCRITVEQGHFNLAWIGALDPATKEIRPVAWAGQDLSYVAGLRITAAPTGNGLGPAGEAVREQRVVVCPDIASDPRMAPWRDAALACEYRSSIALPLQVGGQVIGVFCVYAPEPDSFGAIVTESLIEVAASLAFALELFERTRQREIEQQQLQVQHSALEAAANAIVITNRDGTIEWVNTAFTRLTGYTREEAIGNNPRVLKSGLHDPRFYRQMWETVLSGAVWQGSLTNKRKDGTLYDEEMTITPVRSQTGEIMRFVAIKQDVTERKKLEQQFLRAQRMQSIGLLAGGVAHDLNNVLTPVLMALPLLQNQLRPEQRDHLLQTLEQGVKRGANIIQQVLTFARGVEVRRALLQLRHLIKEVVKISEETFPRDIAIRASVPADLWPLQGDPTQVHQVLLNLAVNARDAMPEGGQLSFTARNVDLREPRQFLNMEILPGRYVAVAVADIGAGIESAVLERIFEPFFTTKPVGKGTGLGLSTVLGIVKSHGGLVEVQSQVGAGSTFTVYLPAAPPEAVPTTAPPRLALPEGHGETVLVVDDEPDILEVTGSALEACGYRVLTAKDGVQALARFAQHGGEVKAVVTDLMMPVMDGLALTRSLRKQDPRLPVIATTGLMTAPGDGDRAGQLRELGVKHFLRKPFHSEHSRAFRRRSGFLLNRRKNRIRHPRSILRNFSPSRNLDGEIDRQEFLPCAIQSPQPLLQCTQTRRRVRAALHAWQLPNRSPVLLKREPHLRKRQRRQSEIMLNMSGFRFLRAKKFPARRQIEEQLAHFHRGPGRDSGGLHFHHLSAVDHHSCAFRRFRLPLPRRQRKAAHTRNARQRLPTKSHRANRRQVLRPPNLARGMPLQTQQRVVPAHPHAVITHPHQAPPARLDIHRYARRLRVQSILHQLLHHTGRPFNHLARGNLIRHLLG